MPLQGSQTSAGNQFTPIVTNNGAFSVKIIPMTGKMEERPSGERQASRAEKINIGDSITGEKLGTKDDTKYTGKVLRVQQEDAEIVFYLILDEDGEEVQIDPTTASKHDFNETSPEQTNTAENPVSGAPSESVRTLKYVKLFEEWLAEHEDSSTSS